ncbi:MAG TPA: AAA family ATPase [Gaiellaceae bacterium]|nr:AAA family ATPase [Gaiellaceae bacterium]
MFVGRAAERERIDALLAFARAGSGGALVLRGEPGIGKSALLRCAEERSGAMRVLSAHGVEAEAELPFSGLYELLRPVLDLLDEIPERQAAALKGAFGLGPPLDRSLLIGAGTLSLLAAAAEERPVLCLIDDAHWLDAASSDAFVFLARRLEADSIAMLFAARDGDPRTFEPPGIEELVVSGLERGEAAELMRGSGLPERVVIELHRAATGNPLALLELPGALNERQRAGQEPLPEPLPVTKAIQASYARRIQALPESTRRALIVAAAEPSGRLVLIERACAAVDIDPAALAAAEDAELLDIVDARAVFRHPLASSVAYHAGKPTERRLIHAALAEAVGAEDASRHAWHTAEAAAGPDEDVAATLESAARAAFARSGYRSAATTLERAAALTPDSTRRAQRLYFAAIMHFYSHGIARALTLLDQAESLVPGGDDEAQFRLLRLALWYYRDSQRAATLLLDEAARPDARPRDAAFAAALAACFRSFVRDAAGSLEAAERTREYAARGDGPDDPIAGVGAGNGFVAAGRPGEAGALRDDAVALLRAREWRLEHPEDWKQGYSGVFAGGTLLLLGEHDELHARIAALSAEFVPGDEVALMLARGFLGTADYLAGRWTEARAGIGDCLRLAAEIGWLGPQVYAYVRVLAQLAAAQGAEEDARAHDAAAAPYAGIAWASHVGAGALALLALGRLEYAEAVERYEAEVLPRVGPLFLYHDVADAIEAYLHAGRTGDAARWLHGFAAQARESAWPWALARAAHLEALSADEHSYEKSFEEALEWHERARQPFLRARTELAYGDRLRREGLRREARNHLRVALATFEGLGAAPWAEQAASQLRSTGEHVRQRTDPDTSALTPQELQVALVVARGATNKEAAAQLFLSPKTIEKHLGSAYAKLGLRSRAELARIFASRQPTAAVAAHA